MEHKLEIQNKVSKIKIIEELINTYTQKIKIRNQNFYNRINKLILKEKAIKNLNYTSEGIILTDNIIADYQKLKATTLFGETKYLGALSRILADIYDISVVGKGEKEANKIIRQIITSIKRKYSVLPDFEGYLPTNLIKSKKESHGYGALIMGNIIRYLFEFLESNQEKEEPNITEDEILVEEKLQIQKIIKRELKLPPEERDYLVIYFRIESFLAQKGWSKEEIRENIKNKFNTRWLSPKLSAIFNVKGSSILIMFNAILLIYLEEIREEIQDYRSLQSTVNTLVKKTNLEGIKITESKIILEDIEKKIYDPKNIPQGIDLINNFLLSMDKYYSNTLGSKRADKLFNKIFLEMNKRYGAIPKFREAIQLIPAGMWDKQRLILMNPAILEVTKAIEESLKILEMQDLSEIKKRFTEYIYKDTIEEKHQELTSIYRDIETFVDSTDITIKNLEINAIALREKIKPVIDMDKLQNTPFQFMFLDEKNKIILLFEEYVEIFIKNLNVANILKDINQRKRNASQKLKILKNTIGKEGKLIYGEIEKNLQDVAEEDRQKELNIELSELFKEIYILIRELLSEKITEPRLKEAFIQLREKYPKESLKLINILPKEVMGEEHLCQILIDAYMRLGRRVIDQLKDPEKTRLSSSLKAADRKVCKFKLDVRNKELNENFSKFFKKSVDEIKLKWGEKETERIFKQAYKMVEKEYGNLPIFAQILAAIPRGILEAERFRLLSREELEKITKELRKTEAVKTDFVNVAAHELKTPLVPMKGFLDILTKDPKKFGINKKGKEYMQILKRNTERLSNLVSGILDISKLEAGEMKFEIAPMDLSQILHDEIQNQTTAVANKKLTIIDKVPKIQLKINGDDIRIQQVIGNLIKNSIKFTDTGTITVTAMKEKSKVRVEIKDTGSGIDKEDQKRLFTKFYQAQDIQTRKTKGSGLGLAISKEIITKHNGTIWVESEGKGKGSTFIFTIPLIKGRKT